MRIRDILAPFAILAAAFAIGIASAQIGGGGIQSGGGGATPVTGNFTLIWNSGFSVNQNQVINYSTLGNLTTLRFTADVTGTSNGIGFTNNGTNGIPVAQRPSQDATFWGLSCTDNGAVTPCCLVVRANGGMDLAPYTTNPDRCTLTAWTGSGTKGMQVGASRTNQITYSSL